jgi:hypothetical protein
MAKVCMDIVVNLTFVMARISLPEGKALANSAILMVDENGDENEAIRDN